MKKAQVNLIETILVLLLVIIVIVLGIFVYYKFFYESLSGLEQEIKEEEASILLHNIGNKPEFECSREDCIDMGKVVAFFSVFNENRAYYSSIFGKKRIIIEQVYPVVNTNEECNIQKYRELNYGENCRYWVVYDNVLNKGKPYMISSAYSLYFPTLDEYRLGNLIIEVFK